MTENALREPRRVVPVLREMRHGAGVLVAASVAVGAIQINRTGGLSIEPGDILLALGLAVGTTSGLRSVFRSALRNSPPLGPVSKERASRSVVQSLIEGGVVLGLVGTTAWANEDAALPATLLFATALAHLAAAHWLARWEHRTGRILLRPRGRFLRRGMYATPDLWNEQHDVRLASTGT